MVHFIIIIPLGSEYGLGLECGFVSIESKQHNIFSSFFRFVAVFIQSGMSSKRVRLSGCAYEKLRKKKKQEEEKLAGSLNKFIVKRKIESSDQNEDQFSEGGEEAEKNRESERNEREEEAIEPAEVNNESYIKEVAVDSAEVETDYMLKGDFALIPFGQLTQEVRDNLVSVGSEKFQNLKGPFAVGSKSSRRMTEAWFYKKLGDGKGEIVKRTWLLYSPSAQAAYCFCCVLFPNTPQNAISKFQLAEGYNGGGKWKDSTQVAVHETTTWHRKSFLAWKEAEERLSQEKAIDKALIRQLNSERDRGKQILMRILSCIRFLASQNLAFRGSDDSITTTNSKSQGNFMALVRFIAEFDPVLKEHLDKNKDGAKGRATYLSPVIQNEFIALLAKSIQETLVAEVRESKYFGIMCDSTPDISHQDQHSLVVRYMVLKEEQPSVKEAFLDFMNFSGKDAEAIEEGICNGLQSLGLDFNDCRAVCFDNANVMAGKHTSVQRRLCEKNPKIVFINCDNHSLNLAGANAVKNDVVSMTFFNVVNETFNFFSRSTGRWEALKKITAITLKSSTDTRWSSRADATQALQAELDGVLAALEEIASSENFTAESRAQSEALLKSILTFEFLASLSFWTLVLRKIDIVQKRLQSPAMTFADAYEDLQALAAWLQENRESCAQEAVNKSKDLCDIWGLEINIKRVRRKKCMPGELAKDEPLTPIRDMKVKLLAANDRICEEIQSRSARLHDINERFGVFLRPEELFSKNEQELCQIAKDMALRYDGDFTASDLSQEVQDLKFLVKNRVPETAPELFSFIKKYGEGFANLGVALRILMTVGTSVASCERSFSKLKLIKTYLRSSMGQKRLSNLALLSIESNTLMEMDFSKLIDEFAHSKARKMLIS